MSSTSKETKLDHKQQQLLLNQCFSVVAKQLAALLQNLFNRADSALLDRAESAVNDDVKYQFYQTQAFLNKKKEPLQKTFLLELKTGFDRFLSLKDGIETIQDQPDSEFSLIDHETIEESTIISNICRNAHGNFSQKIFTLTQRLSVMHGGEPISSQNIPGSPYHLVESFNRAMKPMDPMFQIRLIILHLFDEFVVCELDKVYQDYNRILHEAGILPNIKVKVRNPDGGRKPGEKPQPVAKKLNQDKPAEKAENSSEEQALLNDILGMMNQTDVGTVTPGKTESGATVSIASQQVVEAIEEIHVEPPPLPVDDDSGMFKTIHVDQVALAQIDSNLKAQRQQLFAKTPKDQIDSLDASYIELVGKLFEYMLKDPVLPALVKALLSHLHTTYLKVAIQDRKMLTDSQHVARQLFDKLIEGGSHWVDENQPSKGLYPDIQRVVNRILREFKNDLVLFEQLLTFFSGRVDDFKRKSGALQKRVTDSAQGREKLSVARLKAARIIGQRIQKDFVPSVVSEFLQNVWSDVLIFILLRHNQGMDSNEWKKAVKLMDELVCIFDPNDDKYNADNLDLALQSLRGNIKRGLKTLGGHLLDKSHDLFDLLSSTENIIAISSNPLSQESRAKKRGDRGEVPGKRPEEQISSKEKGIIEKLRQLPMDTWFEFTDDKGIIHKEKITWISTSSNGCIFVNAYGQQTTNTSLLQVARQIIDGKAQLLEIDDSPFFSRAIKGVHKILKNS